MNADLHPHKSTNVRTQTLGLRATREGIRALSPHAPSLTAIWAERLFLTARRHARPSWERSALASARAGRVRFGDGWLPTWTWRLPEARSRLDAQPTALLVHGWEGRGSQLAAFVPALLARGLRVVTFDAPGHGDSPLPRASLVEHAHAIVAVAAALGPVHAVVGHSVGGAAALFATRLGLDVERLALIAPPRSPAMFATTFARELGLDQATKARMIARVEARYGVRFEELDVAIDAERFHRPLLVVHDVEDPVVSIDTGRHIAERAPRGELLEVTGLGHRALLRDRCVIAAVAEHVAAEPASFAATLEGELFFRDERR